MQEWIENKDLLLHSTRNEGRSVTAKRFIKKIKAKSYKK